MNMSVSSIVSKNGKREIYVLFTEGSCSAEGRLSDYKLISNKGFSQEEADMLEAFMRKETDRILQMAKNVNVMDAFLNS